MTPTQFLKVTLILGLCAGVAACGVRRDTGGGALGAITAKTDSQVPVVSYVSAYPVALIVMILIAKVLIGLLG